MPNVATHRLAPWRSAWAAMGRPTKPKAELRPSDAPYSAAAAAATTIGSASIQRVVRASRMRRKSVPVRADSRRATPSSAADRRGRRWLDTTSRAASRLSVSSPGYRTVVNARHRLTAPAVLALGIAVASPLLWLWPDDGVVDGWTVGVALWQAMPFALLLLFQRVGFSDAGTVVTAVVIAALTASGYVVVERDDSSTAGIALLLFPLCLSVLVVIAFFVDLGLRHVLERFANRSAEAS